VANGLMLKVTFLFISLFSSLFADKVKTKTLACPSVLTLQKAAEIDLQDSLTLEMYSIAHGCVILTREDSIQALGYDPRNAKDIYQKILYKKNGSELYLRRSAIEIEQGGKKNNFRF
jgi:hypothetical protein